ncbi:polyprenyl synthetase family protein [Thiomicrospira cyclica]|uniref:Octaprenyl diphosphate synthase n=1 Tax=Thiomicrospira cyclica (strain DSM 14477 / JCM 11371 / ALM1) TaxID=717773 RepID=F6D9I4_THICA|nr:polyprenyl synthetase family protein [Thiomicrospira cyclica]AEG30941.1 Trans-hexaprenyltranstransferase [Thiomicrospira cyclica ALM1]
MTLADIKDLMADDLRATDKLILERLASDVVLINQIGHYIINNGGKRLRPLIVLLSARACGYQGTHHLTMAAVIEFIHTSTLLHDDVVDESNTRRGNKTANEVWGNAASVLVGDFLYSRAFEMMVKPGLMSIMQIMSESTNVIAEGEVLQLLNCHDAETDEHRYMDVIERKTAKLFEAAALMGSALTQKTHWDEALAAYGRHLGAAFQLIDDVLDYTGDAAALGKSLGDDLAEGKPTLPLIYAMQQASKTDAATIKDAIEAGDISKISQVTAIIQSTGAIGYTITIAQQQAKLAQAAAAALPRSPYQQAMSALADLAVNRNH